MTTKLTSSNVGTVKDFTVSWQSVITADGSTTTNVEAGKGYFIDTTSAAHTVTLPASATIGDIIHIKDYAGTFSTNNLTILRNGHNIQGVANDSLISTNRASISLFYIDSTKGWLYRDESNVGDLVLPFIVATGGTETTSGDYKIHTFTGDGTFCVSFAGSPTGSTTVDYLVVAGGGGAKSGGGGAGGMRYSFPNPATGGLPVSVQGYPVTVGAGGGGDPSGSPVVCGSAGSNSVFSTITSAGGALGGGGDGTPGNAGGSGSGGGGGGGSGGSGNTPPVSPSQGSAGGSGAGPQPSGGGGGGGGHSATGGTANSCGNGNGGAGGNGTALTISGSSVTYAGGGGGGSYSSNNPATPPYPQPSGGSGGGGDGGQQFTFGTPAYSFPDANGCAAAANTGGGGGGGVVGFGNTGGAGGKGIVIIRYKYQ
jgi:hypothetical protein